MSGSDSSPITLTLLKVQKLTCGIGHELSDVKDYHVGQMCLPTLQKDQIQKVEKEPSAGNVPRVDPKKLK